MPARDYLPAIEREIALMRTQTQHWVLPICVAVVMMILIQFALDEPQLTREVMPRLYSVMVVLVMFLTPETLFKTDFMTGYLHQYALSPLGFVQAMMIRLSVQGVWMIIPLLAVFMIFIFTNDVSNTVLAASITSVAFLFPILFLMAALSSALTITLPNSSLLSMVMLMPLVLPPLIVSQSMVMHAQMGVSFVSDIYLLCAIAMVVCATLPAVIVWLLRNALG